MEARPGTAEHTNVGLRMWSSGEQHFIQTVLSLLLDCCYSVDTKHIQKNDPRILTTAKYKIVSSFRKKKKLPRISQTSNSQHVVNTKPM